MTPVNDCIPTVLKDWSMVGPKAPLVMAMGRPKVKFPLKRGENTPGPEAASLRNVSVPALPPMLLLERFKSTVAAVLVVVMAELAVTLIGLGTGSVLAVRLAFVISDPPARLIVPVPSPTVLVLPSSSPPVLIVVSPL